MNHQTNFSTKVPTGQTRICTRRMPVRMVRGVILLVFAFGACIARADTITDWNVIAFDTFKAANVGGNPLFRALAIMHVDVMGRQLAEYLVANSIKRVR